MLIMCCLLVKQCVLYSELFSLLSTIAVHMETNYIQYVLYLLCSSNRTLNTRWESASSFCETYMLPLGGLQGLGRVVVKLSSRKSDPVFGPRRHLDAHSESQSHATFRLETCHQQCRLFRFS